MNTRLYQKVRGVSTIVRRPSGLSLLARNLLTSGTRVFLLSGPLGAGKTTFVRGALRSLGVRRVVTSPTFTLSKTYRLNRGGLAAHIDAYRVEDESELRALELQELLQEPSALVFVEWPERLPWVRWPACAVIEFEIVPSGRRVRIRPWAGGRFVRRQPLRRPRSTRSK